MLNLFKSRKESSDYPTLTSRLFAAIIDFTILMFFLIPIQSFFTNFIGNRALIEKEMSDYVQNSSSNFSLSKLFTPEFQQKFFNITSQIDLLPVIVGQLFQLVVLTIFVLFFWIKYQATPGKFFISAKIVSASTNRKPSVKQLITRYFSYSLSCFLFFIGFFIIPFNRHRRGLHDFIAGTKVVSTK